MRGKINESKAIFDKIYGKPKKVKITTKVLDKLWSKAVKLIANNKCEYCGSTQYLNSHHIFGRRNFSVRFEVNNGVCLCAKHHQFNNEFSAHQTPSRFIDWIKEKRGQKWYDELNNQANTIKPNKEYFKKKLDDLINEKNR